MEHWFSVVPFLIAIIVAMLTRQVLAGLVLGLVIGSYSLQPGMLGSLSRMIEYILTTMTSRENLRIIIILYVFGGFVGMLQIAGGIKGFAKLVARRVKTGRSALMVTWATVLVTFMDCEFRIMTTGPIMKAVRDEVNVTRSKLAYAIDVSTVPVIVLIPVATTYAGYMVSVVGGALQQVDTGLSAYQVFLTSIPFNFWAMSIVAIGLVGILTGRYIGRGLGQAPDHTDDDGEENEAHRESIERELEATVPKPWNLILPLLFLLTATFYLIWVDGRAQGAESLLKAMQVADVTRDMLVALVLTTILSLAFFLFRKEKLDELMFHFVDGGNQLMMPVLLLILVWSLAAMSEDLHFTQFVTSTLGAVLPRPFVPVTLFLFASLIGYLIGTSWGTWGLLMPLGVSLAVSTGATMPLVVGAVFAGGAFGDFTSPLGETTLTTAAVYDLPVVEYAKAKLPSSLTALGAASILFLVSGMLF